MLGPDAAAVGRTLGSLRLEESMNVQVSAIRRKGVREVNPKGTTQLQEGDVVLMLGTQENLAKAEIRLLQG
jgi:CPA2 family monovalent cation:H+ antiporter-2